MLEADAISIQSVEIDIDEESQTRCRISWAVTIKLRDAAAFRTTALAVAPDVGAARGEIDDSLAAAWHCAAEPYAPLRTVPGINWSPVEVTVEQVYARDR